MRKIGRNGSLPMMKKKIAKTMIHPKNEKIQDAYTLLYMSASWIFAYLPQIDSLPTERRPCDFFLFYLSLLIII